MSRSTPNPLLARSLALSMFFLLATPISGFACSYISYPDPPTAYIVSRTKTIFIGTLLQKTFSVRKAEGDRYRVHSLLFRIEQSLKGELRTDYRIEYWERISRRSSCDVDPPDSKVGQQWVIFDDYDEGDGTLSYVLNPELISWQYLPEEARSRLNLQEIRDAVASPRSTFHGEVQVVMLGSPPSNERRLTAELLNVDRSSLIRKATVGNGRFSFSDLESGTYFIRLRSSRQEKLLEPERVMMQKDDGDPSYFTDFKIQMLPRLPEYRIFTLDF